MNTKEKRSRGQWDTVANPFTHPPAIYWLEEIQRLGLAVIEPFVGQGNIVQMLPHLNWMGFYDIEIRPGCKVPVVIRDTISDFPEFANTAVITNPPWLATRSAKARGLSISKNSHYDDVYKEALSVCLNHADYVAAIVPESFIRTGLFRERLSTIVSLPYDVFAGTTEHPACLALFIPKAEGNPCVWRGDEYLGTYSELTTHPIMSLPQESVLNVKFCDPAGEIGIFCMDSRKGADIRFTEGSQIGSDRVKRSSRHVVRIKLPVDLDHDELSSLLLSANKILSEFRSKTFDLTLTASRSLRKDGLIRRRLDFDTAARILTICLIDR